jgi:hypothetical protein
MRLTTATTAAVAVALTIAAPPAWARPELTTTTHAIAANRMPATVYSRPDKSMIAVSSAAASSGSVAQTASAPRGSNDPAPTPAELSAARRAAANPSASLDRFALANVHKVPLITTSANSSPEQFNFGDAAIGAGVTAGLMLLGIASLLAARRRRQPLHT